MKKLIVLIVMIALLSGCSSVNSVTKSDVASSVSRFQFGDVGSHLNGKTNSDYHYVLTDKPSKVQYLVVTPSFNSTSAGIATTVILSTDGKPYIETNNARGFDPDRFISSNQETSDMDGLRSEMYQYVLTDQLTGVQYLVVLTGRNSSSAGVSITPMLNQDGKPLMKNESCNCTIK